MSDSPRDPVPRPPLSTKVKPPAQVLFCKGCCCGKTERRLPEVPVDRLKAAWKAEKLNRGVQLTISGCLGPCDLPNVAVVVTADGSEWYGLLDAVEHYEALIDWARACVAAKAALPRPGWLAAHRFDRFEPTPDLQGGPLGPSEEGSKR